MLCDEQINVRVLSGGGIVAQSVKPLLGTATFHMSLWLFCASSLASC